MREIRKNLHEKEQSGETKGEIPRNTKKMFQERANGLCLTLMVNPDEDRIFPIWFSNMKPAVDLMRAVPLGTTSSGIVSGKNEVKESEGHDHY